MEVCWYCNKPYTKSMEEWDVCSRCGNSPKTDHDDRFEPDWTSPPGETIEELIHDNHMEMVTATQRLGLERDQMYDLLSGHHRITDELAGRLAEVLGGTKQFWINREANYRKDLERLTEALDGPVQFWIDREAKRRKDLEHLTTAEQANQIYAKALQERKEKQFKQGEEDAIAGKPPVMDELAYIQGYEKGLARSSAAGENDELRGLLGEVWDELHSDPYYQDLARRVRKKLEG